MFLAEYFLYLHRYVIVTDILGKRLALFHIKESRQFIV